MVSYYLGSVTLGLTFFKKTLQKDSQYNKI